MNKIVVTGEKGGVGKSTITCLLADWLNHQGQRVEVVDADPNETTRSWLDFCEEEGRIVSVRKEIQYRLVDTAGRHGGGLKFLHESDLILAPFQPHTADLLSIANWFRALNARIQQRVAFIPNRVRSPISREQRAGIKQLESLIASEEAGVMLPMLVDRVAVYPEILDGSSENFFAREEKKLEKAHSELSLLFKAVIKLLA